MPRMTTLNNAGLTRTLALRRAGVGGPIPLTRGSGMIGAARAAGAVGWNVTVTVIRNDFGLYADMLPGIARSNIEFTIEYMKGEVERQMVASSPPVSNPGDMPAVDSGDLINSLQARMESDELGIFRGATPYIGYLEWGTSKMAPRPSFTPVARLGNDVYLKLMRDLEKRFRQGG